MSQVATLLIVIIMQSIYCLISAITVYCLLSKSKKINTYVAHLNIAMREYVARYVVLKMYVTGPAKINHVIAQKLPYFSILFYHNLYCVHTNITEVLPSTQNLMRNLLKLILLKIFMNIQLCVIKCAPMFDFCMPGHKYNIIKISL